MFSGGSRWISSAVMTGCRLRSWWMLQLQGWSTAANCVPCCRPRSHWCLGWWDSCIDVENSVRCRRCRVVRGRMLLYTRTPVNTSTSITSTNLNILAIQRYTGRVTSLQTTWPARKCIDDILVWCGQDIKGAMMMTEDRDKWRTFVASRYGPCWPRHYGMRKRRNMYVTRTVNYQKQCRR